jgi:hypothetical protein
VIFIGAESMSQIMNKIHSRGYWRIVIRPDKFLQDRIKYSDLLPILQRISVQNASMSIGFPHIDPARPLIRKLKWIEDQFDFLELVEAWRFYQSGQFAQRSAMWLDWQDQPGWATDQGERKPEVALSISEIVLRFTEIYEFAARLALSEINTQRLCINITVCNLGKRFLFDGRQGRVGFVSKYRADITEFPHEQDISQQELISGVKELALNASRELFARFDWNPSHDFLQTIQARE